MHTVSYPPSSTYNAPRDVSLGPPDIRSLLLTVVNTTHDLYSMECRDRPNVLARLLVSLYELGADKERLSKAYLTEIADLELLRSSVSPTITKTNWQDHLGKQNCYRAYLDFFDKQVTLNGLETVLETYFYTSVLHQSIGSQLQPLVHIAFGLEQNLSPVVVQGLAYLASTFWDVGDFLDAAETAAAAEAAEAEAEKIKAAGVAARSPQQERPLDPEGLLLDLVLSDQRFDGKIEGTNTFGSAVRLLLKSKSDLLGTYVTEWATAGQQLKAEDCSTDDDNDNKGNNGSGSGKRLSSLTRLAVRLMATSARNTSGTIEMDGFLGGQLLESALAIQTLANHRLGAQDHSLFFNRLINLQFLAMLCTYIVQGRPRISNIINTINSSGSLVSDRQLSLSSLLGWKECMNIVVQSDDSKAILAIRSLATARDRLGHDSKCLETANLIAKFVQQGSGCRWIKGGTGWV
ncbi:hypothetical protein J3Q64DRAFT_1824689 [Phycomyces blakesleeanus]|uniref:Uncharacterized protein n=2 Tax=Phycomyces blakesleeanus TaxID=4837 RepID=A0A162UFJ6_PHYB8|nr:hypothetical protein PHYBLDRAFT_180951 [Phycomyces blakesleeanus NRRL 1555(-)]OAD74763.1 hypothetical protein PHYBLDRAFT_180951 [Phycomyces blakesleeanus NRRL 1555(-)]|eukprot:XP_018292803.1 hypothetical protein PHYBLDRAFT_180951 [Phycomyces blakesleeanus NRRL 1555(-)]